MRFLIPGFAGGKDRFQAKIIPLTDRIVLVVMTIRTADGQPQQRFTERGDLISPSCILEHLGKFIQRIGPLPQSPDRNCIRKRPCGLGPEFISGHLLHQELVIRLILIQTANDIIPVTPRLFVMDIGFKSAGIGIADNIEPMSCPPFPVLR